jgi:hypothetical protein
MISPTGWPRRFTGFDATSRPKPEHSDKDRKEKRFDLPWWPYCCLNGILPQWHSSASCKGYRLHPTRFGVIAILDGGNGLNTPPLGLVLFVG